MVNLSEEPAAFIFRTALNVMAAGCLKFVEHLPDLTVSSLIDLDSREYGRPFSQHWILTGIS
jgi:hypothetical protein